MAEKYDIAIRVISQKGRCSHGHKVGDEWVIEDKTPAGMCVTAYNTLFPYAFVLRCGGSLAWEADPDVATNLACTDADNPVVFELRRLRK